MNTTAKGPDEENRGHSIGSGDRVVYVMPADAPTTEDVHQDTIVDALATLWRQRWWVVGLTAAAFAISATYVLLTPKYYRAEVLLMPVSGQSDDGLTGRLGSLGGLASLAGINLDSGGTVEPVATLKSVGFVRQFIEEQDLVPVLFADDWDAKAGRWKSSDPADWPDVRDAVRYFERRVRTVEEDKKTGLVVLAIEWKDPDRAAAWANLMADKINARMRQRALSETETNVKYLTDELATSQLVAMQQALGRILESEQQKLMLARGRKEFAFRVIDRAESPRRPTRPKRLETVILATIVGGLLSVFGVLVWQLVQRTSHARGTNEVGRKSPIKA